VRIADIVKKTRKIWVFICYYYCLLLSLDSICYEAFSLHNSSEELMLKT